MSINHGGNTLTYSESNGEITITGGTITNSDLVIPETISGKPVVAIGNTAFSASNNNDPITTVSFPSSLETIGFAAFYNKSITAITFPEDSSLKEIKNGAFQNNSISTISFPSSIEKIRDTTFENNAISSLHFPVSLKTIGWGAFRYQTINSVTFAGTSAQNGGNLTSIGQYAFIKSSGDYGNDFDNTYDGVAWTNPADLPSWFKPPVSTQSSASGSGDPYISPFFAN